MVTINSSYVSSAVLKTSAGTSYNGVVSGSSTKFNIEGEVLDTPYTITLSVKQNTSNWTYSMANAVNVSGFSIMSTTQVKFVLNARTGSCTINAVRKQQTRQFTVKFNGVASATFASKSAFSASNALTQPTHIGNSVFRYTAYVDTSNTITCTTIAKGYNKPSATTWSSGLTLNANENINDYYFTMVVGQDNEQDDSGTAYLEGYSSWYGFGSFSPRTFTCSALPSGVSGYVNDLYTTTRSSIADGALAITDTTFNGSAVINIYSANNSLITTISVSGDLSDLYHTSGRLHGYKRATVKVLITINGTRCLPS